jgi:hypothetical protein
VDGHKSSPNKPPVTGNGDKQRDLLSRAMQFQQHYVSSFQGFENFQKRTRKWLYLFAGRAYELGCPYKEDDASFKLLADAPFFKDDREKPKKNNVMKTLVILGMSARPHQKELRGLAIRIGAVLEDFYVGGVPPEPTVVAEKLKAEGGIYKLYGKRSEEANADDVVQADFDLLSDRP